MESVNFWIRLLTATLGTAAFSIIFRVRIRHLPLAVIGGGLTFCVYAAVDAWVASTFAAAFAASGVSAIYSELCARWHRAPAPVFLLPCAIPIVPGGSLYRCMFYLISKNTALARLYFWDTVTVAIGIAGGLSAVSLAFHLTEELAESLRKRRGRNTNT